MSTPRTLPPGFHTITPMLAYKSAAAAIEFYIDAFEAAQRQQRPWVWEA